MISPLNSQPQWIGKAHLVFDYFSCSSVLEVYRQEMIEVAGFPFSYKYENLDVYYDQRDIERHVAALRSDSTRIEREIDLINRQIDALLQASEAHGIKTDVEAFDAWFAAYRSFLPVMGLVFGLELALDRQIKDVLSEEDFHKIAFAKEMPTAQEQKSLLRLTQLAPDSSAFNEGLADHVRQFAWLGNKMMRQTPFTKKQFLERIDAARPTANEKQQELERQRIALETEAQTVMERLSDDHARLVHLYQDVLALRTERADAVCQAAQLTHPLFAWIGDRLGMTREELLRFSKKEIDEMLETGERKDPASREKFSMSLINGVGNVSWGSWGNTEEKITGIDEIRGTVACRGMARGIVKIVNEVADMHGFQKGNVLVASYTNPNLLPVMELSSAIVTNIGGLTSHAAIVSRELNKPCVIGTKIATSVLKNGDEVEVDAEKGVVRVMRRA